MAREKKRRKTKARSGRSEEEAGLGKGSYILAWLGSEKPNPKLNT